MQIVDLLQSGTDLEYKWPSGETERYHAWLEYHTISDDGGHEVRLGFGKRAVYGADRVRVVVWIDGYPHAEFFGTDDFDVSGDLLSEIKVQDDAGEHMCRYATDTVPDKYAMFSTVGLKMRVLGNGVRNAWAVVANIADHRALIELAALRRMERSR